MLLLCLWLDRVSLQIFSVWLSDSHVIVTRSDPQDSSVVTQLLLNIERAQIKQQLDKSTIAQFISEGLRQLQYLSSAIWFAQAGLDSRGRRSTMN